MLDTLEAVDIMSMEEEQTLCVCQPVVWDISAIKTLDTILSCMGQSINRTIRSGVTTIGMSLVLCVMFLTNPLKCSCLVGSPVQTHGPRSTEAT